MPQWEPRHEVGSDVPDGFEFLNEPTVRTSEPHEEPQRERRTLLLVLAIVAACAVVALVAALALRSQGERDRAPSTASPTQGQSDRLSASATPSATTTPGSSTTAAPTDSAAQVLEDLAMKGRAPTTGYDRERFGPAWADVDRNGCDTRNDVLQRDLTRVSIHPEDKCIVEAGALADPYSGRTIDFTRGWETSYAVQIDHVVALSNAWQTGAQYWKPRKRLRFANDPLNLLAVDGELNLQKSDGDAATWLPPNKPYRCEYVARQVAVKAKYGLWVTPAEHDAIVRILDACPGQNLPTGSPR